MHFSPACARPRQNIWRGNYNRTDSTIAPHYRPVALHVTFMYYSGLGICCMLTLLLMELVCSLEWPTRRTVGSRGGGIYEPTYNKRHSKSAKQQVRLLGLHCWVRFARVRTRSFNTAHRGVEYKSCRFEYRLFSSRNTSCCV